MGLPQRGIPAPSMVGLGVGLSQKSLVMTRVVASSQSKASASGQSVLLSCGAEKHGWGLQCFCDAADLADFCVVQASAVTFDFGGHDGAVSEE